MGVGRFFVLAALVVSAGTSAAHVTSPTKATPSPRIVVAIFAFGPQAKLDRLEAFAKQGGFPTKQLDAPEGRELVIVFPLGTNESAIAAFVDRARDPEFSSLKFRFADAPAPK